MKYLKQIIVSLLFPDQHSLVVPLSLMIAGITCVVWAFGSIHGAEDDIKQSWLNVVAFGVSGWWIFTVLVRMAIDGIRDILRKRQQITKVG